MPRRIWHALVLTLVLLAWTFLGLAPHRIPAVLARLEPRFDLDLGRNANASRLAATTASTSNTALATSDAYWSQAFTSPGGLGLPAEVISLLTLPDGRIVAGGAFDGGFAIFDGSAWSTPTDAVNGWTGVSGWVWALAYDSSANVLYLGGDFYRLGLASQNGPIANGVAGFDLDTQTYFTLPHGTSGYVGIEGTAYALALYQGELYVGGYVTGTAGLATEGVVRWNPQTKQWRDVDGGTSALSKVEALHVANGLLYVGGDFTSVKGGALPANYIAAWNGTQWSALGGGASGPVKALASDSTGLLYVGGASFNSQTGTDEGFVDMWDGAQWQVVGTPVSSLPACYSSVNALAVNDNDILFAAGFFDTPGRRIAKWDGTSWSGLGSGVGDPFVVCENASAAYVNALTTYDYAVYVGGTFTTAGGKSAINISRWLDGDAVVGDLIWEDANGNGIQNGGEYGVANVTVYLYRGLGLTPEMTTTTNANGYYSFTISPPPDIGETFYLEFDVPSGYYPVSENQGNDDRLDSDFWSQPPYVIARTDSFSITQQYNWQWDGGLYRRGTLAGRAWQDTDGDGVHETGEPVVSGITVTLGTSSGVLSTTQTSATGVYTFANLTPGTYIITFTQQAGYVFTLQDATSDDLDSDVDRNGVLTVTLLSGQLKDTNDAGYVLNQPALATGYKFHDLDGDGVWDQNEPPLVDWSIYIDSNNNGLHDLNEPMSNTLSNGAYTLTLPASGTYTIREVLAPGWKQTTPVSGSYVVQAVPGQIVRNLNFGNQQLGAITGRKYEDVNGNGDIDPGEPGVAGWTVWLDMNGNGDIDTGEPWTTTNASGYYTFTNVIPGVYTVTEEIRPGWTQTEPGDNQPQVVTVTAGQSAYAPFGNARLVTISGLAWEDFDRDGLYEPLSEPRNERTLAGITVTLASPGGGVYAITQTNSSGQYTFTAAPGTYLLQFDKPAGYDFTIQDANNNLSDTIDSDVDPATGRTVTFTLSSGQQATTWFAGYVPRPATLAGHKFHDLDGDGVWDQNEPPMEDWTIYLDLDGDGQLSAADMVSGTTASGAYTFTVYPGTYTIREVVPTGWRYVVPETGEFVVTVSAGQVVTGLDFGNQQLGAITGRKYEDVNGNGDIDPGEPGVAGWTVWLDMNGNGDIDTGEPWTTTNASGYYTFTNVIPGVYTVTEEIRPGWTQTEPGDNQPQVVTVTAGQSAYAPFGNARLVTISGLAWEDIIYNGILDSGEPTSEPLLAGVTVTLASPGGGVYAITRTNSSGQYTFTVAPGTYLLQFDKPAGYFFTLQDQGTDERRDSDADPITGRTISFTLTSGVTTDTWSVGFYRKATVTGVVFHDLDADGTKDANEPGLAGETIFADTNANGVLDPGEPSFTTANDGVYTLTLTPGTYAIYRHPSLMRLTWNQSVPIDPPYYTVSLLSNGQATDKHFGLYTTAIIGDRVWHDSDVDGIQDANEQGMAEIVVTLYAASSETAVMTTTTDISGYYTFTNVLPGSYYLQVHIPAGWYASPRDKVVDTLDSDIDAGGFTSVFTVLSNDEQRMWDAGLYQTRRLYLPLILKTND